MVFTVKKKTFVTLLLITVATCIVFGQSTSSDTLREALRHLELGNEHHDRGDFDLAIAEFTEAARIHPSLLWAYYYRAMVYFSQRNYDNAIADFTEAIRRNPIMIVAYINRGAAFYNKGDYDNAITDFEAALRISPDHAVARRYLDTAIARRAGRMGLQLVN